MIVGARDRRCVRYICMCRCVSVYAVDTHTSRDILMGTFFSHACVLSFGDAGWLACSHAVANLSARGSARVPRPPRPRVKHCHMRRGAARIPIADHRTRARESILRIPSPGECQSSRGARASQRQRHQRTPRHAKLGFNDDSV